MNAQELVDRIDRTHGEDLVILFAEIADAYGEYSAEQLWADACALRTP